MSDSLLTQVLGNSAFYTSSYLQECLLLTKSLLFKNHEEAKLYNEALRLNYPRHNPESDLRTWRYYRHLQGLYHELDAPIQAVSVDNGSTIVLSRETLAVHKKTRLEILKFGQYFDDLARIHPTQQLFLKAVATEPLYSGAQALIELPDYTLISCNQNLIEENEHDLIPTLQWRVNNYKSVWLLAYYQNLDNLFLASQYHILYQFLLTSLLGVRLSNAKTMRAHSFHIRLYLASHYRLDEQMLFLSRRQQLYLYRNLLYFSNHAGKNHVFRTLINELFNEHNVSVVNYVYNQQNETTLEHHTDYVYNQRLLNSKRLIHTSIDYPLEYLKGKEAALAPSNRKEYAFNIQSIDRKNKSALVSTLLTKDLETILIDETDSVKYRLIDTVTDYWAHLLKHDLVDFLCEVTDPLTNITLKLSTRDAFKLYTLCLHAAHGVVLEEFPLYRIKRVFRLDPATPEQLQGVFFERRWAYDRELERVCEAIPMYRRLMTSYEFGEFVSQIYKLNIGLWHLLTNHSDMHAEGQMAMAIDALTEHGDYVFSDESVAAFLVRTGLKDPRGYDKDTLDGYAFSLLDEVFDRKLSYLKRLKKLQQALSDVFFNFNSYTVQLINNYYNDSPVLAGVKDRRYLDTYRVRYEEIGLDGHVQGNQVFSAEAQSRRTSQHAVDTSVSNTEQYKARSEISIDSLVELNVQPYTLINVLAYNFGSGVVDLVHNTVSVSDTEVFFKTDFEHTGNRLYSAVDVFVNVGVNSKTRYKAQVQRIVSVHVGAEDDPKQLPVQKSSDPHLLFLALNP